LFKFYLRGAYIENRAVAKILKIHPINDSYRI